MSTIPHVFASATSPLPLSQLDDNFTALNAAKAELTASTTPLMDGAAAIGSATTAAKADHVHPTDTSLTVFTPSGTGAVPTTVQAKLRESVSVKDFGAVGDGVTDDTAAIQSAINAAIATKKTLLLNSGIYKITSSLSVSGNLWVIGEGRDCSVIESFASGSVIVCAAWGGKITGISVYVNSALGNGIEVGTNSRNCAIEDVYVQLRNAYMSTSTGAGIFLNAIVGFSGGITIHTSYVLGFKYGISMVGPMPISANTWTTVSMYNVWVAGNSAGILAGSAGIYMNGGTNGIGTIMLGGTIETFAVGIRVDNGSFGGIFETDMEGNTVPYVLGNAFNGRVVSAFALPARDQALNGSGGVSWYKSELPASGIYTEERYYSPQYVLTSANSSNVAWTTYHNASLIDGNPVDIYGLKFQVGVGQGSGYGAATHPGNHYIRLGDNKIHWGNDNPQVRQYNQSIGTWKVGDICWNLTPSVGQPKGWICITNAVQTTGAINSGSAVMTVPVNTIPTGAILQIIGAGAAGGYLFATVTSGGGTTNLTLNVSASTTVAVASVTYSGTWVSEGNL